MSYDTPDGEAIYSDDQIRAGGAVEDGRSSKLWLVFFTVALGLLVSTKWYGVMGFGVSFVVLIFVWLQPHFDPLRPTLWGNPRGFRIDAALATIVLVSTTVYALVWVPDLARHSPDPGEIHNANDLVYRQYSMFEYHDTLKATHPYSSKWWEWPIDYVPIAYFYQDHRKDPTNPSGCCVYEITSMPNPVILWFGLVCVPWVAVLAWRERNKAYALIVIDVPAPVVAVDTLAAHHVRLPFLRGHPADLFVQRHNTAASLAVGTAPRRRTLAWRAWRRRLRGGGGVELRLLLSDFGCPSD